MGESFRGPSTRASVRTYLGQSAYRGCLEQRLAHAAGNPELFFLARHLGTVDGGAMAATATAGSGADGVCVDCGDSLWPVEDAEGSHDNEVPRVVG